MPPMSVAWPWCSRAFAISGIEPGVAGLTGPLSVALALERAKISRAEQLTASNDLNGFDASGLHITP